MSLGPINYAPALKWHQKPKLYRRAAFALLLTAIAFGLYRYGPSTWRTLQIRYWESRCLSYSLPPETILYTEEPATGKALLDTGPPYWKLSPRLEAPSRIAQHPPSCWNHLYQFMDPPFSFHPSGSELPDTILFLHERTAPAGRHYLILAGLQLMDGLPLNTQPFNRLNLWANIIEISPDVPVPNFRGGMHLGQGGGSDNPSPVDTAFTPGTLVFYAGQPDPANPSKFILPWTFNGVRYNTVGTLTVDTDTPGDPFLTIKFENPP